MEAAELHPSYLALKNAVVEVVESLAAGSVSERQAAVRLAQLRARDSRGVEWTVGVQTLH